MNFKFQCEPPKSRVKSEALAVTLFLLTAKQVPECFSKRTHLSLPLTVALPGTQVYSDRQEDEMGTVGYFPRNLVEEQHVYQEATKEVPTTVSVSEVAREIFSS